MEDKFSYSSNIVMRKKNISSYFFNESVQDIYQDFSILARKELWFPSCTTPKIK